MCTQNSRAIFARAVLSGIAMLSCSALAPGAQPAAAPTPASSVKIQLPPDSPVALLSADWGETRTTQRGGAMVVDLRTALTFRNSSERKVRGVTLLVLAQELTPGGKASVSVPSLDAGPGESFPIRIDLRLLRPLPAAGGPLVEVSLDGVLFEDLSFYGPNRLNSRRSMTAWELEARRDRQWLQQVLAAQGPEGLRKELLASLARQAERPRLGVQVARGGRATVAEATEPLRLAFLHFPGSPVEALAGQAFVVLNEARSPSLEVVNRSPRAVRYLEVGWIVRDRGGREFLAGSVPAELRLAPGARSQVLQQGTLRFSGAAGRPLSIQGITGFVSQVEFEDGSLWIPSRDSLRDPLLQRALAPSPEEQRLTGIYRRHGLEAVIQALR